MLPKDKKLAKARRIKKGSPLEPLEEVWPYRLASKTVRG
jgi:hypothetical protein